MRRKDCEITDASKIREIIEKCDILRLGLVDEAGLAYIVPVNFGVEGLKIREKRTAAIRPKT